MAAMLEKKRNPSTEKNNRRVYVSPTLYTTPEATPLPDTPVSFTPSPYIINHKRRGPRLLKSSSQNNVIECRKPNRIEKVDENGANSVGDTSCMEIVSNSSSTNGEACDNDDSNSSSTNGKACDNGNRSTGGLVDSNELNKSSPLVSERDGDGEDFFDPRDLLSVETETEDNTGIQRLRKPNTPLGEYFDAFEELSIEGTPHCSRRNIEEELQEIRLNISMEIERRRQAEEALNNIQNQWQRIGQELSHVGLTLPEASTILVAKDEQQGLDPAEEFCQQVFLARAVANSIGRGIARAEVEQEMESQVELKNFEITRLWDRLHYYEAMNHEMSQRNQEAVEKARQQRLIRKRKMRWVWSSVGLAIGLGFSALACSYLLKAKGSSIAASQGPKGDDLYTWKRTG